MYWKLLPINSNFVEVYKNPDCYEISKINGISGVRATLLNKIDLYVWEYDLATHFQISYFLKGEHKLSLVICQEDDFISFQRSSYSSKDMILTSDFVQIPCISELIKDKMVYFFAFPGSF